MTVVALPKGWPDHVQFSLLYAIALASAALSIARSHRLTQGLRSDLERATHEIALLKEELALKDASWSRLSPPRCPHDTPVERMRILQLKADRRSRRGLGGARGVGSPGTQTGSSQFLESHVQRSA